MLLSNKIVTMCKNSVNKSIYTHKVLAKNDSVQVNKKIKNVHFILNHETPNK